MFYDRGAESMTDPSPHRTDPRAALLRATKQMDDGSMNPAERWQVHGGFEQGRPFVILEDKLAAQQMRMPPAVAAQLANLMHAAAVAVLVDMLHQATNGLMAVGPMGPPPDGR